MAAESGPWSSELSLVVRFAPGAGADSPRGVVFRVETGQRVPFSTFAELELALRNFVASPQEHAEEQISVQ
jgi:hypothetical protein